MNIICILHWYLVVERQEKGHNIISLVRPCFFPSSLNKANVKLEFVFIVYIVCSQTISQVKLILATFFIFICIFALVQQNFSQ